MDIDDMDMENIDANEEQQEAVIIYFLYLLNRLILMTLITWVAMTIIMSLLVTNTL